MLHRTKGAAEEEEEEEKEREKEAERQEEEEGERRRRKGQKKFEMVAYACNLRTWETEAAVLTSMRQE